MKNETLFGTVIGYAIEYNHMWLKTIKDEPNDLFYEFSSSFCDAKIFDTASSAHDSLRLIGFGDLKKIIAV